MEKEQNVRVKPNTSCCCLWLPASRHVDTPAPESRSLWACRGEGRSAAMAKEGGTDAGEGTDRGEGEGGGRVGVGEGVGAAEE